MKDNSNLLDFNVWSAGEYNKNTNGINTNCIIQTTKEHSNIGENSIKIINNTGSTKSAYSNTISCMVNKTYTLSCTLYNPGSQVNVVLISNKGTYSVVSVPPSNVPKRISVSYTTTSDDSGLTCRWNIFSNYCFIDDIVLISG